MKKFIAAIPDLMIIAGGVAVALGAGLLHTAAGFIAGGVMSIAFGVLAAKAKTPAVE